jgi:hypothetical protein
MMRLRRASAIVALYLLTSAATASAECAWVLWISSLERAALEYAPVAAMTTKAECEQARQEHTRDQERSLSVPPRHHRPARAEGEVVFTVADVDVTPSPSSCAPTSPTGTAWERTPWHATQRAAWETLRKG